MAVQIVQLTMRIAFKEWLGHCQNVVRSSQELTELRELTVATVETLHISSQLSSYIAVFLRWGLDCPEINPVPVAYQRVNGSWVCAAGYAGSVQADSDDSGQCRCCDVEIHFKSTAAWCSTDIIHHMATHTHPYIIHHHFSPLSCHFPSTFQPLFHSLSTSRGGLLPQQLLLFWAKFKRLRQRGEQSLKTFEDI